MSGALTEDRLIAVPSFAFTEEQTDWRHLFVVASVSIVVHFFLGAGAISMLRMAPQTFSGAELNITSEVRQPTRLVAPPSVLTQRAPNRAALSQEFNLASLPPRPAQPKVPSSPGAAAVPRQKFVLPEQSKPGIAGPSMAEAPSLDLRPTATPPPPFGQPLPAPPPPQIQPKEEPKLAFERPGVNTGTMGPAGVGRVRVPRPAGSVEETVRQLSRRPGGGLIVGDKDAGSAGVNPSAPSVPVPGKLGSSVELLSDPQGVDFWPYMVKVLSTVRRNWFSVIPESARMGRQGRTIVQFAINKDGTVAKVVFAASSGTEALDRAAVAGISASNPFPPLPVEFKGSQVRLQFAFKYNVR